jgi:hypothetical protein
MAFLFQNTALKAQIRDAEQGAATYFIKVLFLVISV